MPDNQGALIAIGLDDYVQAGLIDDVDVEIVEIRAVMWDYAGQVKELTDEVLAVRGTLKVLGTPDIIEHHWSAGTGFVPNADGTGFVRAEDSTRTALAKGSNWHMFHWSLHFEAGMPKNKLRELGGLSLLDGAIIHVVRVPEPARPGLAPRPTRREGQPRTTLVCKGPAKRWPWDVKGKPPARKAMGPATVTVAVASVAETNVEEHIAKLASDALGKAMADTDVLPVTKLRSLVFSAIGPGTDRGLRGQATNLACNPDFLAERGYVLEEGTVSKVPV